MKIDDALFEWLGLKHKKNMCSCPFHGGGDNTPPMGVNEKDGIVVFHCFSGNTRVITRNGVVSIGSVVGKKVEVLTRGSVWVPTVFKNYGVQELYKLTLERNTVKKVIYTTEKHRWFVTGTDSRQGSPLFRGEAHTIKLLPGYYLESVFPPMQRISLSRRGIQHGFVFGDGTLYSKGAHSRAYFCGDKKYMKKYFTEYTKQNYSYADRDIIGGLSGSFKLLPSIESDNAYLFGFLAGVLAADGCVDYNGSIVLHNKSREVIQHIKDIATRLGLVVYSTKTILRETNYTKGIKLPITSIQFAKGTFPKELLLMPKHSARFKKTKSNSRLRWKVVFVENTHKREPVFCCNVPRTHSFALEDFILTGNCFACNASGKLPNLVAKVKGVSYEKAVELLEKKFFVDDYKSTEQTESLTNIIKSVPAWEERGDKEIILPDSLLDIYDTPDPTKYMEKRGLDEKLLRFNEIGYDRWKDRVTLPVRNSEGKLVGIVGRTVKNAVPKYEMYDNFPKSRYLYGMHHVQPRREIVVCEGHITKLWIEQCTGNPNVVALQGCLCSEVQANWLAENAGGIVMFLDNDKAGREGEKLMHKLLKDRVRKLYRVPWEDLPDSEGADAANLNAEGVRGMIESRKFAGIRTSI